MPDTTRVPKPWTVLTYTVADDRSSGDSLDGAAQLELKSACDAADFSRVSIAAQVDFKRLRRGVYRGTLVTRPPRTRGFKRVRAEDHPLWRQILGSVEHSVLRVQRNLVDLNAADAGVLTEFLQFGCAQCPADRYIVFFYGHAYGPMGLFYDTASRSRDPNTLRLNDLAGAFAHAGHRAAIVVFRDCFMNTLETACQLRGAADFMIATQSLAPIAGIWPWVNFMSTLMPGEPSAAVAEAIAKELTRFLEEKEHRGPFADVPYSLLDLDAVDEALPPLKALADALDATRAFPARVAACAAAIDRARVGSPTTPHDPGDPALLDVPTLCDGLQALDPDPVAAPARALDWAVRNRLVRWHRSQTGRHKGISLYCMPTRPGDISHIQAGSDDEAAMDAEYYRRLALCSATGWDRIALNPLGA